MRATLRYFNATTTDGDYYRTRVQTNASREPRDEYATVAVSVTDFQASKRVRGGKGGVGRIRLAEPPLPCRRDSQTATRRSVANCASLPRRLVRGRVIRSAPLRNARLRFPEFQEEPLRRGVICYQAESNRRPEPKRIPNSMRFLDQWDALRWVFQRQCDRLAKIRLATPVATNFTIFQDRTSIFFNYSLINVWLLMHR